MMKSVQIRPLGLIIGAMKSGTTTLFQALAQHPQVAVCRYKEPNYFSDDINFAKGDGWYRGLWRWNDTQHRVAVEASTSYAKFPSIKQVPERIAESYGSNVRLLYIVRDPIARIESEVRHGLRDGWGRSLDLGMPKYLIDQSDYALQLEQYLPYFSRDQFLVFTLEEFSLKGADLMREICEFLRIDSTHEFTDLDKAQNTTEYVQRNFGGAIKRSLKRTIRQKKWYNPKSIAAEASNVMRYKAEGRWKLYPEERSRILDALQPGFVRLQELWGIDPRENWNVEA